MNDVDHPFLDTPERGSCSQLLFDTLLKQVPIRPNRPPEIPQLSTGGDTGRIVFVTPDETCYIGTPVSRMLAHAKSESLLPR